VGGVAIDANAVRTEMVRHGADFLSRFERLEEKQAVVEELVRIQVLAQTAREAGYADLPSVREALDRLLAEHYWREQVASLEVPPVTDEEVRAEYDGSLERYTEPLRARGAALRLRVPSGASGSDRAALRAHAKELREMAVGADAASFAALVRAHSDDLNTRDRGGDMGFVAEGASVFRFEPEVIEALFGIAEPGALSPVVETPRSFSIVRLTELQGGKPAPLAAVAPDIRRRLTEERLREAQAAHYAELRSRIEIEVDLDLLETLGPRDLATAHRPPSFPVGDNSR
jgi:parvulin-like peptidyl-prolyl isomerase